MVATRHSFIKPIRSDEDPAFCFDCGEHRDEGIHDEPEPLPEPLSDALEAALEALEALGTELQRAGGTGAANSAVAYFCAYHQADVEGKDAGGWLGGPFLRDALRTLSEGGER